MTRPEILTKGEWESLLHLAVPQVRALVLRLGVHHGAFERTAPKDCPICGKHPEKPEQMELPA